MVNVAAQRVGEERIANESTRDQVRHRLLTCAISTSVLSQNFSNSGCGGPCEVDSDPASYLLLGVAVMICVLVLPCIAMCIITACLKFRQQRDDDKERKAAMARKYNIRNVWDAFWKSFLIKHHHSTQFNNKSMALTAQCRIGSGNEKSYFKHFEVGVWSRKRAKSFLFKLAAQFEPFWTSFPIIIQVEVWKCTSGTLIISFLWLHWGLGSFISIHFHDALEGSR